MTQQLPCTDHALAAKPPDTFKAQLFSPSAMRLELHTKADQLQQQVYPLETGYMMEEATLPVDVLPAWLLMTLHPDMKELAATMV
jgi:hypothetical protein